MARIQANRRGLAVIAWIAFLVLVISDVGIAERLLKHKRHQEKFKENETTQGLLVRVGNFLWQDGKSSYEPIWPEMKFGWKSVLGTIVGFLGAALGSFGGGGIFVPMLSLIIGFDPKSSTTISMCMIMGVAGSTEPSSGVVLLRVGTWIRGGTCGGVAWDTPGTMEVHPWMRGCPGYPGLHGGPPLYAYAWNQHWSCPKCMFSDWMVTVLLIILFIGTSTKALFKGIDTWKKETMLKKVPLLQNIYWKELSLLVYVWIGFLIVQIIKEYLSTCSVMYWIVTFLQIPIAASVTLFEAICLCKGTRVIASKGKEVTNWMIYQILLYCSCGIVAGMVGGLLGLGGGFILGPLFLELGIPPQVASATSTFSMVFSSSMSVVQYYILNRFPVPYAAYFVLVATIAAFAGQHVVRRIIAVIGRASIIIFILALTIFVSAISLGGVGIANMVKKLVNKEYMGFENLFNKLIHAVMVPKMAQGDEQKSEEKFK
ncbi:DECREASED DNA METHYLATION 1 family protein [Hibiscus syriacus]|uniref:DECREASED DNA METHYLATION 1 family protein n=1 Tax=Hibiscus syriacus TaxID=106335 RepID=A0A6A2WAI5_HIBSY|nr:DECREASED DNA METHYLATION 1 family protein [Hibiscus syriacus]